MTQSPILSETLLSEAASWRVRLTEDGSAATPEFEAWRSLSPDHQRAWAAVDSPWQYLGDQRSAPELIAVRSAVLERARRAGQARWGSRRAHPLRRLASVAAVAALAAAAGVLYLSERPTIYQTHLAERRVVTLDDGSTLSLDSQSEVAVRYTRNARELVLVRGQARFDVAHDAERPFSVEAADRKVIATGTSFDVDLVNHQVIVTLIEGHVLVLDKQASGSGVAPEGVKLDAGERLVAAPHAAPSVQHVNVERATAWQSGQLVFENETLASALERVNRYARHPIIVKDPAAAALRFSGVFNETNTQAFTDSVTRYLSLEQQTRADGSVELRRRD
jgi:transmembrane sensor